MSAIVTARLRTAPALAALSTLALLAPGAASAQQIDAQEFRRAMQEMRQQYSDQIERLRRDYETKLKTLEDKIDATAQPQAATAAANVAPAAGPGTAQGPSATAAPSVAQSSPLTGSPPTGAEAPAYDQPTSAFRGAAAATGAASFNPAIGAVLTGQFSSQSRDPDKYTISGFALGGEAKPDPRGFAIGESEINAQANVDQWLFGNLTVSFAPNDTVSVEEAFLQTTSLPGGFTFKAGRFFSGVGYMNEQHAHVWDFVDPALPYRAFFGTQYGDDGAQLRWIAPTDVFIEFGAEGFRGDAFPAGGAAHNGVGTWSVFGHVGDDIGVESSWRAGLSYLSAAARGRLSDDDTNTLHGRQRIGIFDAVYKWAPDGNPVQRNLKLQGEVLYGGLDGTFNDVPFGQSQWGWYGQAIYQFMPQWRVGLRHDEVQARGAGDMLVGTALDDLGRTPRRSSAMIDYSTSEFGRFRFQYNLDDASPATDHQFFLQYTISLGAHGAHGY